MGRLGRIVAVAALAVGLVGCGVNAIPTKREAARARWGDVQSTYQRRADLIPNLVSTVQAAANQERAVLVEVTQARASATQVRLDVDQLSDPAAVARFEAAQNTLSGALSRLLVVTENYPQLQANQNFRDLQGQLEGTENRINVARRDYNLAVQDYNTELATFPGSIWASTIHSGNRPMQAFSGSAAAQNAPTVTFNIPGAGANTSSTSPTAPAPPSSTIGAPPPAAEAAPPGTTQ